ALQCVRRAAGSSAFHQSRVADLGRPASGVDRLDRLFGRAGFPGGACFVWGAASISDQPLETVLSDASILQAVLLDTDFGRDWLLRLLLIALLAGLLAADL